MRLVACPGIKSRVAGGGRSAVGRAARVDRGPAEDDVLHAAQVEDVHGAVAVDVFAAGGAAADDDVEHAADVVHVHGAVAVDVFAARAGRDDRGGLGRRGGDFEGAGEGGRLGE